MAIFVNLDYEDTVQVDDKLRLDASRSFVSTGTSAISKIEIDPDGTTGYIDVTADKYLDWQYSAAATTTISVRVTAGVTEAIKTFSISVITATTDHLFSDDHMLKARKYNIFDFLPDGKSSFKYIHRDVQRRIVRWLDKEGYQDNDGNPFTKTALVDIEEVKEWATFMALRLIYEDSIKTPDDLFSVEAKRLKGEEVDARNRAILRIDFDGDGVLEDGEQIGPGFGTITRR